MSVNDPGKALGQYAGLPTGINIRLNKASANTVTRGLVTRKDTTTTPDSYTQAAATALLTGPFAIPVETAGAGTTEFSARYNDVVYLRADGAMEPYTYATTSGTTAGEVVAGVAVTNNQLIGICLGTAETWQTGSPAAAADGDLVAIYVPLGGFGNV